MLLSLSVCTDKTEQQSVVVMLIGHSVWTEKTEQLTIVVVSINFSLCTKKTAADHSCNLSQVAGSESIKQNGRHGANGTFMKSKLIRKENFLQKKRPYLILKHHQTLSLVISHPQHHSPCLSTTTKSCFDFAHIWTVSLSRKFLKKCLITMHFRM